MPSAPGWVPLPSPGPPGPEGGSSGARSSAGAGAVGRVRAGGCGSRRLLPAAAGAGGGFLPPPGRAARAAPWSGPGSRCPGPGRRCPGSWLPQVSDAGEVGTAGKGLRPRRSLGGRCRARGGGGGRAGASRRPGGLRRRRGRYRHRAGPCPRWGWGRRLLLGVTGTCPERARPRGTGASGQRGGHAGGGHMPCCAHSEPCRGHSEPCCATSPGDSVASKAAGAAPAGGAGGERGPQGSW